MPARSASTTATSYPRARLARHRRAMYHRSMLAVLVAAVLSAPSPQDTALDVPVYRNETFGIALPRPFDDWVFEPATIRGTTTVIFHPRDASLRDQPWGALLLPTFNPDLPLPQVAHP